MNTAASTSRPLVLVVDDDEDLRPLVCDWLDELGYATRSARDGREAMALLASTQPALLFTDVKMPGGMDGFELAMAATRVQPSIKVCFASGHAWGPSQRQEPGTLFLHKPYTRNELAASLLRAAGE